MSARRSIRPGGTHDPRGPPRPPRHEPAAPRCTSRSATSPSATAAPRCCTASGSRSRRARWWRCSVRTAPARRRSCARSQDSWPRHPEPSCSTATTSERSAPSSGRGAASPSCPTGRAWSPSSRSTRTSASARSGATAARPATAPSPASTSCSSRSPAAARAPGTSSRAASGRCSRSAARSSPTRCCSLLDEPSLGLAPLVVAQLMGTLRDAAASRGLTVLLAEQNVTSALSIADRGVVLDLGRVVADAPAVDPRRRRDPPPRLPGILMDRLALPPRHRPRARRDLRAVRPVAGAHLARRPHRELRAGRDGASSPTYVAFAVTGLTGSYWAGLAAGAHRRRRARPRRRARRSCASLRTRSPLSGVIVAIGLVMVLQSLLGILFGAAVPADARAVRRQPDHGRRRAAAVAVRRVRPRRRARR